jgi:retron-type reverse transcriptase
MDTNQLLTDLFKAYYDARRNKRNTVNQLQFELHYEQNIFQLYEDIRDRRYTISPSICFIVSKPVKREVFAADFRDRVVHHLLFNYINPFFEETFIEDSYSCRKNKGTMYGVKRVERFIRECSQDYTKDCYILKLDIKGYFMNINKEKLSVCLRDLLNEQFRQVPPDAEAPDADLIFYLIDVVLQDDPTQHCRLRSQLSLWEGLPSSKSLFHSPEGCGLPIGNLTSQLFSNVYLHAFDRYMKEVLALPYYGRYVDDFVVIHPDRAYLKSLEQTVRLFLKDELQLELHPLKIYLQHYSKGVTFLGVIIKPHRLYIARRTKNNFYRCISYWDYFLEREKPAQKDLQLLRSGLNSYLGILRHYRTYNIRRNFLLKKPHAFFRYGYLEKKLDCYKLKKKL